MLLMLMAYPSIHIGLTESSTIMQEEFHSSLNILIIFFILQLLFHAVLVAIFMLFLFVYVKMVKINILTANKLFSDKKFLELQDRRVEQLKIMSNLYQEDPNKISDKIESIENNYRKKMGNNIIQKNKKRDISNDLVAPEEKYLDSISVSSVNQKSRDHTTSASTSTNTKIKSKQESKKIENTNDEKKEDNEKKNQII